MKNQKLESVKRIGTGLAFILYPVLSIFAYAVHPDLFSLEIVTDVNARVEEFHGNALLHFGHVLMLLGVPLLIIIAHKFMDILKDRGAWLGFVGGVMAIFGAVMLAVDKSALCLVPSAFDTLPEAQFAQLLPGIQAMFDRKGWLVLLWLLSLPPVGFMIQGIALYIGRAVPRWQSVSFVVSMLLMGVSAAVDIDLVGLIASVILALSFIPFGLQLTTGEIRVGGRRSPIEAV